MSLSLLFWVLMVIGLAGNLWSAWPITRRDAGGLFLWVLLAILGWAVFGAPIR